MTVELDPERFRKASTKTGDVRDKIKDVIDTLKGSLDSGSPWGNDKIGSQFYDGPNGYGVTRKNLYDNAGNFQTTFGDFSKGQTDAATKLENQDRANFRR
ncbi:hypothetical protein [Nocardia mexicana]|uniref:WXG100 family type VII secretion target n=1 Tax=Nocardia mexicana TaxID=279262 RepID=A0A370GQX7_9NOCA|nr:hypothetical protein [Nocardia mexicana]RDI46125.1 hypothetical protein DFR68_11226 [Nocardia mexicana]